MQRRIEQLINGIYEYEAPKISFSTDRISKKMRPGERCFGSFSVESSAQKKIRGFLYSSDARVACEPRELAETQPRIKFDVDACGLKPGDVITGSFTVCTNVGEASLPFCFEMVGAEGSGGGETALDLDAFAQTAKESYAKAYRQFVSEEFERALSLRDPSCLAMYQGLRSRALTLESLEEFLVGTNRKEQVCFALKEDSRTFDKVDGSTAETLEITRSGWGFRQLTVASDAAFLLPQRSQFSTEDFLGSSFALEYLIDEQQLHAGLNFGRITLKSAFQTLVYSVTVKKASAPDGERQLHEQKKQILRMYEDYVAYRLERTDRETYLAQAEDAVIRYGEAEGDSVMVSLYQAFVYFLGKRTGDACAILSELEQKRGRLKAPAAKGCHLYLTTFYNKEPSHIAYVREKVEDLYLKNQEEWVLQWILLSLQTPLTSRPQRRLQAICRQYGRGCRSRILFLEAGLIFLQFPLLLKNLDSFEIRVIRFLCRYDLLNRELVTQIVDLSGHSRALEPELYGILCHCHAKYPSGEVVRALCSLLIKEQWIGARYFNWYEKGVTQELRLTGLYENYLASMGGERSGALPQRVCMYFAYDSAKLGDERKAVLYENIMEHRPDERTCSLYRPAVEAFVAEQLTQGNISRELACIYRRSVTKENLDDRMAANLARFLFTHEIFCDWEQARSVAVVHRQLKAFQMVRLCDERACVQIYARDAAIFVVDREGRWHAAGVSFTCTHLLEGEDLLSLCRKLAPESPAMQLYTCVRAQEEHTVRAETIRAFCSLLTLEDIREEYKEEIRREVLDYYYENPRDDSLYAYLRTIRPEEFAAVEKGKTIALFVREGMCGEALALAEKYGPEGVETGVLVRLCSRGILERDGTEDEMLLYLCAWCFERDKYDEVVLSYLLAFYEGPIEKMKRLWKAGKQFQLDTMALEEKILSMLAVTRCGLSDTEEIFASYRKKFGNRTLLRAYVNLMAYEYFVKERKVKEPVFAQIAQDLKEGKETDLVCRLACLRYYGSCPENAEAPNGMLEEILEECVRRRMCFAFFRELSPRISGARQFENSTVIEYRTAPGSSVLLHYTVQSEDGGTVRGYDEMMPEVYEGIFAEELTLFYGETLTYTITEEQKDREPVRSEGVRKSADTVKKGTAGTRYDLLNEMCLERAKCRTDRLRTQVREYVERERMIEQLFPLM